MTPASYTKRGKGVRISLPLADSRLGRLLVAASERDVYAVSLGDSGAYLEDALRGDYSAAEVRRDDGALGAEVAAIFGHLAGAGRTSICRSMCAPSLGR